ncbi:MAG: alpha-glucan family phosphorylase [Terracidiphilus sp.]
MSDAIEVSPYSNADGANDLAELALNLNWSWNHAADELWRRLDENLWETTQNPWVILQTVSKDKIDAALATPEFRRLLQDLIGKSRASYQSDCWFQSEYPQAPLSLAAYFSMEFMLTEALPIYSGGLGNVAGDQMKAASDLGIPVVGVGLLYGQGYFRQDFDSEGRQQALFPINDPGQLPIRPLRQPNGEWLRLQVHMPGGAIWLRCWKTLIGRNTLYLLDANDFANPAAHRCITSELYGGDAEMRLRQEIVLGIGGWRLLRALKLQPEVCHLNEGHAAFAVLERARSYMADHGKSFDVALTATRAGNIFTTHTAVSAGFDRFAPDLMGRYFERYAEQELSIRWEDFLALGRQGPGNASEPFNMAYLAMRGSGRVNAVSKLHGKVSRQIFQQLFPRWPQDEVPISSVTNGVHVPTWDSTQADTVWTAVCGRDRWRGSGRLESEIRKLTDGQLWQMRVAGRKKLVEYVRKRYAVQLAGEGRDASPAARVLDESVFTIGFARRFATYKRPNLLLHDAERLVRLLTHPERPMQLILAGKAHPQDLPGQALVKQWNDFIRRPEVQGHLVFLSDYDMLLTQELVAGVDLWLNTPRRPWEACGTSGMKVLVNGGLNFSERDGWWAEAFSPEIGWAIGDGQEHGEDPDWDAQEAQSVYEQLEDEVIPLFYERDGEGTPSQWLQRVRESMARLTPEFSASRAIREYTENYYLEAAANYTERAAGDSSIATSLVSWKRDIAQHWESVHFGAVNVETKDGQHRFRVQVFAGGLASDQFRVELYADPPDGGGREVVTMTETVPGSGTVAAHDYFAQVSSARDASDYTPRVRPFHPNALTPLEAGQIAWQR